MKSEQVTAWALNELSPEEKAQLESQLQADSAARTQATQTKEFCDFLTQHLQDPNLALATDQREQLQRSANETAQPSLQTTPAMNGKPMQAWPHKSKLKNIYAIAAIVTVLATGAWFVLHEEEVSTPQTAAAPAKTQPGATRPYAAEPSGDREPGSIRVSAPRRSGTVNLDALDPSILARTSASNEGKAALPDPAAIALNPAPKMDLSKALPGAPKPPEIAASSGGTVALNGTGGVRLTGSSSASPAGAAAPEGKLTLTGSNTYSGGTSVGTPAAAGAPVPQSNMVGFGRTTSTSEVGLGNGASAASTTPAAPAAKSELAKAAPAKDAEDEISREFRTYGSTARPPAAPSGPAAKPATANGYVAINEPVPQLLTRGASATPSAGAAPALNSSAAPGIIGGWASFSPDHDGAVPNQPSGIGDKAALAELPSTRDESYARIHENELKDVVRAPLSTFSIDVDTASYSNVRRFLNQNSAPPRDAVRLEELINYFPTNDEGPNADAKEPFAVHVEMASCPWQPQHRLARIAIKGRQLGKEGKPSNLVFLVDVSGSMNEPNKLPLVQQSLRMLTERLGENDRVTMVTYAGNSGLALPPTNGERKPEILAAIDRLEAGGSTHGSAGIRLAYEQAVATFIKGGVNRVILCTDGDFNVGVSNPDELGKLITEKARSGVFLSVLGFGYGNLKDRTMETLADKGNGNYAYIDSLSEARKVLVEQMNGTLVTIAKDVKIQVEFNPAQVRSYRLLGYEKRLLAKEDFNDDTKDAGEIGAGHNVIALYELVPANLPLGAEPPPMVDKLKYQRPAAAAAPAAPLAAGKPADSASREAFTVKLRYKEPDGDTSKLLEVPVTDDGRDSKAASAEFKFSAAVAGFGLLLRDSSYAGDLKWEKVRQLALEGKGADKLGYRGEFLQLIEKARSVTK